MLKKIARSLLTAWETIRLGTTLSRNDFTEEPQLLYAGMVPPPGEKPSGGAVKLSTLADAFPECGVRGNILYLVTSCLPAAAITWARTARSKGVHIVLNQNGVAFPAWASQEELRRINSRNRTLLKLADHVIFQSEFCREACQRWVGQAGEHSVIFNPVDTNHFVPQENARPYELLVMGSHSQPDRIRQALETIALARREGFRWRLRIVGRLLWPNAESEVANWLQVMELGGQVDMLGAYSQREAVGLYNSAQILLHLQDKDASPTVPIEAMACGLAVVGIASGGVPEIVSPATGVLLRVTEDWYSFHYPAPREIFTAVQSCLSRLKEISPAARRLAEEKFSRALFLENHDRLFRKLAKGNP